MKIFLYSCENNVMLGKIFLCPAKFSYVYWQVFGYVRAKYTVPPPNKTGPVRRAHGVVLRNLTSEVFRNTVKPDLDYTTFA